MTGILKFILVVQLTKANVEPNYLSRDNQEVDNLADDKDEEDSMIVRADTQVEPEAVVVISFHALVTCVAVM